MKWKAKSVLKSLTPPLLWEAGRRVLTPARDREIRFEGTFKSWAEAEAQSTGYGSPIILERTIEATRKVVRGDAAFERDSVTFDKIEHNFPLAWALQRAITRHGRLHVLDFGGALGSTYFQSRALIDPAVDLKWAIVEQPLHVEAGSREFANKQLSFHHTIEAARERGEFDILLLSGVIQCLPDPFAFVDSLVKHQFPEIVLDRAPFMVDGVLRLTVQHLPDWIYPASYPVFFFPEAELLNRFAKEYRIAATWLALDRLSPRKGQAEHKGYLFELNKN